MSYGCPEFIPFVSEPGRCNGCGETLTGRRTRWCGGDCENEWRRQHDWGYARRAARRRDGERCVRDGCTETTRLEVNHIVPRNGEGYGWGCWNHQTNLETLCHAHHLEVTKQQAIDRAREADALHRARHPESYPQPEPTLFDEQEATR